MLKNVTCEPSWAEVARHYRDAAEEAYVEKSDACAIMPGAGGVYVHLVEIGWIHSTGLVDGWHYADGDLATLPERAYYYSGRRL